MVASGPTGGIILAILSTSGRGTSSTRPTSRMAARAAIVPKVMIWETFSWPYFCGHVLDHFLAPPGAEVDVDVRAG